MSQASAEIPHDLRGVIENPVTEDDQPVDNMFSAKQQRLLVEPLYSSWTPPLDEDHPRGPRCFLADANVGVFFSVHQQPLVPDMFLSLDVKVNEEWFANQHRSYFIWEFDKVPDVAVEIVSNRKGGEMEGKRKRSAHIGVPYYVVHDPYGILKGDKLYVYEIGFGNRYRRREDYTLPNVGLSLALWPGRFEEAEATWLRWLDAEGKLIPTGEERAIRAEERATRAEAEIARWRAELARLKRQPAKKPAKKRSR